MIFSNTYKGREEIIVNLFSETFTSSEDAQEGALIGSLARSLLSDTPPNDLHVFTSWDGETLVGAAIFSRLTFENDNRNVFVLGPVAVATDRQRQGIGQDLLRYSLDACRASKVVDIALTYGDPGFYTRIGFERIAEALICAPYPLQHPHGWLGQSLTKEPSTAIQGPANCVQALPTPSIGEQGIVLLHGLLSLVLSK